MYELYPIAMDCELLPSIFWEMSILEVCDYIDSYERRRRQRQKQELVFKHFLARDIAQYINMIINGSDGKEPLELWDFFPDLFGEEKADVEEDKKKRQLAAYKAQMMDYTYRHNHTRKKKGGET